MVPYLGPSNHAEELSSASMCIVVDAKPWLPIGEWRKFAMRTPGSAAEELMVQVCLIFAAKDAMQAILVDG